MPDHVLHGHCFRGAEHRRVQAILFEQADANSWRARLMPFDQACIGDRLRFGEASESMACLLAFLDAEIAAISGDEALLSFAFSGAALHEALERLDASPGSGP
jgi:S-adenosylmethionine:tRNA ribosyltransferase-isomerase